MEQDLSILKDQCFQATVCSCGFSLVFLKLFRVSVCLLSVWCCLLTSFPLKTAYRMLIVSLIHDRFAIRRFVQSCMSTYVTK